jgi:hypothetical protein
LADILLTIFRISVSERKGEEDVAVVWKVELGAMIG